MEEAMLHFSRWALIGCVLGMTLVTFSTGANARGLQNGIQLNGIGLNGVGLNGIAMTGSALGDLNGVAVEAVIIPDAAIR
jgi:hypothetical protein